MWGWGSKKAEKLVVDPGKFVECQQLNLHYIETQKPVTPEHLIVYTKLKSYIDDILDGKILWTIDEDDEKGQTVTRPVPKEYLPYLRAYATPSELLRCLRGGQWNLTVNDVAQSEISGFVLKPPVWRIRQKLDLVNAPQFARHLTPNWVYFTEAFDKMGRPIMYMKFPQEEPADWMSIAHGKVYQHEKALRIGEERGTHRITWIIDVEHCGITRMPPKDMMSHVSNLFSQMFVERMAMGYIVNAAFSFRAIWAVGSLFMDKRTVAKIKFLKPSASVKPENYAEHIAPDQLMTCYGGTNDFEFDFRKCEIDEDRKFKLPESKYLEAYKKSTGDYDAKAPAQWPLAGSDV